MGLINFDYFPLHFFLSFVPLFSFRWLISFHLLLLSRGGDPKRYLSTHVERQEVEARIAGEKVTDRKWFDSVSLFLPLPQLNNGFKHLLGTLFYGLYSLFLSFVFLLEVLI